MRKAGSFYTPDLPPRSAPPPRQRVVAGPTAVGNGGFSATRIGMRSPRGGWQSSSKGSRGAFGGVRLPGHPRRAELSSGQTVADSHTPGCQPRLLKRLPTSGHDNHHWGTPPANGTRRPYDLHLDPHGGGPNWVRARGATRKQADGRLPSGWHQSSRLITVCEGVSASPLQPGKPLQVGRGKPIPSRNEVHSHEGESADSCEQHDENAPRP